VKRRAWLMLTPGLMPALDIAAARAAALVFPRDRGAHPDVQTEWWYVTGWLGSEAQPRYGFQLTFFRSRTGLAEHGRSRFAPRQLLFAHAALSELRGPRHTHAQRIARWSGDVSAQPAHAATRDTDIVLGHWRLQRDAGSYAARLSDAHFALALQLQPTQPPLLQGDAGLSRKGPDAASTSRYISEPQLRVQGDISVDGRRAAMAGRAWLDHEWSDAYLPAGAVGWDWLGCNLFDGSALMLFRMRRADGSSLWAGGSFRAPGQAARVFAPDEVQFSAGRTWTSAASQARYPVQWALQCPAGRFELRALMDAQELDSRASTGAIYWEGVSELLDAQGRRVGLGYLEMTGYAAALKMAP